MRVVVVGSGLAGVTVAEGLARDGSRQVTLVTAETHGYYSRPRLSHGFSAGGGVVLRNFDTLAPVRVMAGARVERIERANRTLALDHGRLAYDVLVLAPGSAARIPPPLAPFREQFHTLNSLDDLLALGRVRQRLLDRKRRPRWAIIGGGLIGCEVASDLNKAGDRVTVFHREARLLELLLDEAESRALDEHFRHSGIEVLYNQDVRGMFAPGDFDAVVVATGFAPRTELARDAGLVVKRGILVDGFLRTADPAIHAAGDAAEIGGQLYPFVAPIRSQALFLAGHLARPAAAPWSPPAFRPQVKIHGFKRPDAEQRQGVAVRG